MIGRRGLLGGVMAWWAAGNARQPMGPQAREASRPDHRLLGTQRAGAGPAPATGQFIGRTVVVFGTGLGVGFFEYNGSPAGPTPGPANPPVAYAAPPGVTKDPYGNTLGNTGGGFTAVQAGAGGAIAALLGGGVQIGSAAQFAGTGGATPADITFISGTGAGTLDLFSGTRAAADTGADLALFSAQASPTGVQLIRVKGNVVPIISGVLEIWHVVGAALQPPFLASFSAGGTAPRFQFEPINGGRVRLSGAVNTGAVNPANTAMFTLPAGYRPSRTLNFVTQNNITAYTLGSGSVQVISTGDVQCVPASTAGKFVLLDGIVIELD